MTFTAIFLFFVVAALIWGAGWYLLSWIASIPGAALCFFSGIGVLYKKRREWESARRVSMSSDNGWRTFGEM